MKLYLRQKHEEVEESTKMKKDGWRKISDFVKKEIYSFSIADNIRSIPSMIDGLKPSQR